MSRMNLEDVKVYDPILVKGIKFGVTILTSGAAVVIDRDNGFITIITLTGAGQTVTMPTAEVGLMFLIQNTSATALTITLRNPALATIGTIVQNASALVWSDGVSWFVGPLT